MAHVVLFHHVRGLTPGVVSLAEALQEAGHTVTTPDLFNGETFTDLSAGLAWVQRLGDEELLDRVDRACQDLPADCVYAGLSYGVFAAQHLVQTRSGAKGGLFLHSFFPPGDIAGTWPTSCPVHVYATDQDPFFVGDGDLQIAQAWQETNPNLTINLYRGKGHLVMEPESDDYDAKLSAAITRDIIAALATIDKGQENPPQ